MPEPLISPDGRYALRYTCERLCGKDWVYSPVLVDLVEDRVLLTLADTMWSTEVAVWTEDSQVLVMGLRRYPCDTPCICVRIDVRQKQICLDDSAYSLPIEQLYERLEARHQAGLKARRYHP